LLGSLVCFITSVSAMSQSDTVSSKQIQDTVIIIKKISPHSLYGSLGFGNNMILASTVSQAQPFYFGALSYGYNNEFFASVCSFHLPDFEPFLAYNTFSLNYNHVFNSWFDISVVGSRYQIANVLSDTLFSSFFFGEFTLGVDWKVLYSKLSVGGLFSETSRAYFTMRNSRYFQTPYFFNDKAYISFDPYVNLLFGSLTKTVTSEGTSIGISSPFNTGGKGKNSSGTSSSTLQTTNFLGLMEVDLGLPVGINFNRLTIEAEPGYILPMFSDADIPSPKGFVFLINCSIKIF